MSKSLRGLAAAGILVVSSGTVYAAAVNPQDTATLSMLVLGLLALGFARRKAK